MRLRTQPRMNVYSIMSATKYAAEICYYNGKEVFATQLAVVEYHYVIFIQRIANSIAQSLSVVLDYLFGLLLDCICLVFQTDMVLAEILVKATLLQVELFNKQTARNGRE